MSKVVSMGLQELQSMAVKELASTMPWLKGREMICCDSIEKLKDFTDKAVAAGICAVDLETTGLSSRVKNGVPVNKIVGVCLSYDINIGMYVPLNHKVDPELNLDQAPVFEQLQRILSNTVTIYHHAKFDLQFLLNYGFKIPPPEMMQDTLILARLNDAGEKNIKLKYLSGKHLKQEMIEFAEVAKNKRFDLTSPKEAYLYGASDAICTLQLYHFFMAQETIKAQKSLYENIERKTIFPVMVMETNMIKIDVPYFNDLREKTLQRIADLRKEIFTKIGKEFNIDSPALLGRVLFDELKYPGGTKTKNGQWETGDDILKKLAKTYPVCKNISELRELNKSLGTYVENILKNRDENDCVKLSFSQTGTDTGRFSSPGGQGIEEDGYCGFNVQSLPAKKDKPLMDIRRGFIARDGYTIVAMDYSGEELRVMANLSQEPKWVTAFLNDEDLHQQTADALHIERKPAKVVNFGILYGMGPQSLGAAIGVPMTDAKMKIHLFFQNLPVMKKWIDKEVSLARKQKYAKTALGRIRPLAFYYDSGEDGNRAHADRCAVNHKIQGASADIMKAAMVRIHNWIFENGYQDDVKMLITVHDELVFEIRTDKMDFYVPKLNNIMLLKDILQGLLKWQVPLKVDAEYGPSWHVEGNYFVEHPEGLNEPDVIFTRAEQASGRYAIAIGKTAEYVTNVADVKPSPAVTPVNEEAVVKETSSVVTVGMDLPIDKLDTSVKEENGALIWVLKDREFFTCERFNLLCSFLDHENRNNVLYKSPKQQLVIRDKEGNSLLVTQPSVPYDVFKAMARFLGI